MKTATIVLTLLTAGPAAAIEIGMAPITQIDGLDWEILATDGVTMLSTSGSFGATAVSDSSGSLEITDPGALTDGWVIDDLNFSLEFPTALVIDTSLAGSDVRLEIQSLSATNGAIDGALLVGDTGSTTIERLNLDFVIGGPRFVSGTPEVGTIRGALRGQDIPVVWDLTNVFQPDVLIDLDLSAAGGDPDFTSIASRSDGVVFRMLVSPRLAGLTFDVPEPTAWLLVGLMAVSMVMLRRHRLSG